MAGWWFLQDLTTINKIVVPCFPVVPILNILLSQVPPDLKEVQAVDLNSALVSIPGDPMVNIYYPMANRWLTSIHFDLEQSTRYLGGHTSRLHWGLFLFLPSVPSRCVYAQLLSQVWLLVTPWTITRQAPLSMGFSRQEEWSGLPFPTPRDLSDPEGEPAFLASPALAGGLYHCISWATLHQDLRPSNPRRPIFYNK